MAKKFNTAFIVVSQIRRLPSGSNLNRPPDLTDLKGSGSLEQTADKVLFIYKVIEETQEGDEKVTYYLNLAKNRQGPLITRRVHFEGKMYKFIDIEDHAIVKELKKEFGGRVI